MAITRRDALLLMTSTMGSAALTACRQASAPTEQPATETTKKATVEPSAQEPLTPSDDVSLRITQARHNTRGNSDPFEPFALLHISDVHGDANALSRALAWASANEGVIDDILCTGDLATLEYADGMEYWDQVAGSARVLTCVGNHDVYDSLETRLPYDKVSVSDAAARYIDPFAANWGTIDHETGTTWYAKDYPERNVRLIVLDCMLYIGEHSSPEARMQNAWLEDKLADARRARMTVVIGEHFPLADKSMVECSWAPFDRAFAYGPFLSSDVPNRVQAFIDAGGTFACYLCGHCHTDAAHILPKHPEQFALAVPCTTDAPDQIAWGDMDRSQESTRDAFNLVVIDTVNRLVKAVRIGADRDLALQKRTALSWDYRRHRLVYAG